MELPAPLLAACAQQLLSGRAQLSCALMLCTLGIALDSADKPWLPDEVATVVVLALALVRVATAVVALEQLLAVGRRDGTRGVRRLAAMGVSGQQAGAYAVTRPRSSL